MDEKELCAEPFIGTVLEDSMTHYWYYSGWNRMCFYCEKKEKLVKSGDKYIWVDHVKGKLKRVKIKTT
jgi:hypothetical protein